MDALRYRIVKTDAGFAAFVASAIGVRRSYLPQPTLEEARTRILKDAPEAREDRSLLPALAQELTDYFRGAPVAFDVDVDLADAPPFHRRVWTQCRKIGYGDSQTYAELARSAGNAKAARAVGMAMRQNPLAPIVPCHRVLRSDGGLGGYSGPGGINFKRRLLDMERAATR